MTTPFRNTRIEFHILQSFPVTCLNRDDVGAPKSAIVGGVSRARVSSQCWKRQVRLALPDFGIRLGVRSKKLPHCWPTPVAHWERAKNRLPDAVKRWPLFSPMIPCCFSARLRPPHLPLMRREKILTPPA
ncbi:type I-E CRISPR-associated protein Cas7/Cse4/CasC [Klebsiella pneumoniae]|uniref:type I-E CRISPR-associated protein Cas7/Cse4/CasC n=1 Tax=Klebsiella pneumoniae TaxID=573 RepID=UPI001D0ECC82|nr:type I-E CRISPR-associated protein Cas7/Cse4/CasC [Klebsiella pneumoniae]